MFSTDLWISLQRNPTIPMMFIYFGGIYFSRLILLSWTWSSEQINNNSRVSSLLTQKRRLPSTILIQNNWKYIIVPGIGSVRWIKFYLSFDIFQL